MAYLDEIDVGDACVVVDLRTGNHHDGIILRKSPDTDDLWPWVHVQYDADGRTVKCHPSFVTLKEGEST